MQKLRLLPLVLTLAFVTGCDKSDVDAAGNSVGNAAKGAADKASAAIDGLKDIDLSNIATLDTAKLQQLGKDAMDTIAAQLGNIKDLASAQNVSSVVTPMLEKLEVVKTKLGDKLPDMESVKSAISALTAKFPSGGEVMQAIEPMLTKLKSLVGAA